MIGGAEPPFRTVLVANRGEIAVRVIQACRELRIRSIAVYSEADHDSLHVALADEAYPIGPAAASASYLNVDRILEVALASGAQAIHPGYGFLAENATFAHACAAAGLVFVGPPPEAMEAMGGKIAARRRAQALGVPVVPGETRSIETLDDALDVAQRIGYPLAIKASAGGGGRGLKVVRRVEDLADAFHSARREGLAYFKDDTVFIERYVAEPRHVEVQILADSYGSAISLGQRDCSVQRSHQKLIEEAPALLLPVTREAMDAAAVLLVGTIGYVGAGTLEFLVEGDRFYFLEMNTRIQVEHTVTEMITGIDLVQAQLRIAAGEPLWLAQDDVEIRGHAIECRINAEDPAHGFRPTPAQIRAFRPPTGTGVRVDSHCYGGYTIPAHYDSMIAKLVVWAADRESARRRMLRALDEFVLDGPITTIPFHQLALEHPAFVDGRATTTLIGQLDLASLAAATMRSLPTSHAVATAPPPATGELPPGGDARQFRIVVEGQPFTVEVSELQAAGGSRRQRGRKGGSRPSSGAVLSPMHGVVIRIPVAQGAAVERGAVVCVLEAMKMENEILATESGTVISVDVSPGDTVDTGATLLQIEPIAES